LKERINGKGKLAEVYDDDNLIEIYLKKATHITAKAETKE
jgi:hypothetical protein